MSVNYYFKKGVDFVVKQWLDFFMPGPSYHGTSCTYDGVRYQYWAIQYGTTATSASTTVLYIFDTWTLGWTPLATITNGNRGLDIEYDPVRNVLYIIHGAGLTSWQVFNLNTTTVTIANVSCAARALTTITVVLPAVADYGANIVLPDDVTLSGNLDDGAVASGCTATSIIDNVSGKETTGTFFSGLIGNYIEFTSGALSGQRRIITAVPNGKTLTVAAFGSAPTAGDTFIVITPKGTATSGSSTTLVMTGAGWTANKYAFSDVVILSGTGIGQRRRIASNTTDTLTLAAAVTGNARTGNWTTPPDDTSVFQIVPSSDFVYYNPGSTSNTLYRLDVAQTTGAAWSASLGAFPAAPAGGCMTFHPHNSDPFGLYCLRGGGGNTLYRYNFGLATFETITTYWGSETIGTGASSTFMHGERKIFIAKESQKRTMILNLVTGILEPGPTMPYANPGAYDGKRSKFLVTADGVKWIYHMRPGGQEFFRFPVEWL